MAPVPGHQVDGLTGTFEIEHGFPEGHGRTTRDYAVASVSSRSNSLSHFADAAGYHTMHLPNKRVPQVPSTPQLDQAPLPPTVARGFSPRLLITVTGLRRSSRLTPHTPEPTSIHPHASETYRLHPFSRCFEVKESNNNEATKKRGTSEDPTPHNALTPPSPRATQTNHTFAPSVHPIPRPPTQQHLPFHPTSLPPSPDPIPNHNTTPPPGRTWVWLCGLLVRCCWRNVVGMVLVLVSAAVAFVHASMQPAMVVTVSIANVTWPFCWDVEVGEGGGLRQCSGGGMGPQAGNRHYAVGSKQ
ncbi:hypothetical protein K439DRAFT_1617317 [Ramaria rubella]|nr:hypothetical protein K439DRAFT_1617317 [Ramaria rubella]